MSQRYIGSSISPTAAPTSSTSTTGVWSVNDQYQAKNAGNWPMYVPPATTDPYFQYVSMLLPGNGTNGAQNNTFLDSSTNNFTITRTGNTTQGTFTPYGANWSNYFDGSGDYLTAPNNTAFNIASNNFTIESWVYPTSIPAQAILFCKTPNSSSYGTFEIRLNTNGTLIVYVSQSGSTWDFNFSTTNTVSTNSWNHVALTRTTGGVYTIWINGVSSATYTWNFSMWNSTYPIAIGAYGNGANPLTGYMSNARIVNGTAVYTAAFTPSTTPLQPIANTVLLTCQSNRFIDNSTNNFAITKFGDTSVQRFSPFSPTEPYSAATIGGSAYFDGSGDYLSTPSTGIAIGTGDFTLEGWFYFTGTDGVRYDFFANNPGFLLYRYSDNTLSFYTDASGTNKINVSGFTSAAYGNRWLHIAITRQSGSTKLFLNGIQAGSTFTSDTTNYTGATMYIGRNGSSGIYYLGYISNFRIVTGTAVYTSAFAPPPAPVTAITNTQLLVNGTNAGIIDNAEINDLETINNVQISTSQFKFGGSSIYFDGTSARLTARNNINLILGTSNWTMECWAYLTNITGVRPIVSKGYGNAGGFMWWVQDGNLQIRLYDTGGGQVNIIGTGVVTTNTWYYLAVTRNGNTVTLYVNGSSVATGTFASSLTDTSVLEIGTRNAGLSNFIGYINDFRMTKGVVRTITTPTSAFPIV